MNWYSIVGKLLAVLILYMHYSLSSQSSNGLVAYYPFCNDLIDMSQHGHDGVFNGPVTCVADRFGSPLSAYRFPGIDGVYARVEFSPDFLIQPDSALSISAWYKNIPEDEPHGIRGIVEKHNPINQSYVYDYHFGLYDLDKATFGARYNMVWTQEDDQDSLWYHVVGVYSDSTWAIYQNGHLEDTWTTKEYGTLQSTNHLYIGNNFKGVLDDIYIFRKALTQQEIDSLFHLPSSCISDHIESCQQYITDEGLVISSDTIILDTTESTTGLDSLLYIEIIIHEVKSDTLNIDTCGSYQSGTNLYTQSGEYTEVYSTSNGCDSTVFIHLTIPTPQIQEENGVLTAITTGSQYHWLDCLNNYQPIEGAINPVFIPLVSGTYALEITNECIDTSDCHEVIISRILPIKSERHKFVITPNPLSNSFTLQSDHLMAIDFIRIYNAQGQSVMDLKRILVNNVIPVSLLPGIYTMLIGTSDHAIEPHRIIIH